MQNVLLSWYRRHKALCRFIVGLFVFYTLAGFAVTPLAIRHILKNKVSELLQRKVQAASVRTNPFTFSIRLKNLAVSDRDDGPFVRVDNLYINLDPLISLFKWGVAVKSVEIGNPEVHIVRTAAGRFNFSDLRIPPENEPATQPPPQSDPLRFVLGAFKLAAGKIHFADQTRERPFESTLSDLAVILSRLDTRPQAEAFAFNVSARTESDESLKVHGRTDIQPLSTDTDIVLSNLPLAKYAPYYQPFINAKVADGRLTLEAKVQWSEKTRTVGDLLVKISNLVLNDFSGEKSLATLPQFNIEGAGIDLKERQIQLGRISSKDAQVHIQRNAQGQLNLQAAFAPRAVKQSPPDTPIKAPGTTIPMPAWQILAPQLKLDNHTIDFEDLQPAPSVRLRLHHIDLTAKGLSTQEQAQAHVDMQLQWADQGTLSAQGDVSLVPLQAALNVTAETVDIRPLQPYLKEFVQLVVTKGEFNTQGQLKLVPKEALMDIMFAGQASLNGFEAVDAEKAALFSKWKSLYLTGIDLGTAPLRVRIDEVALTDFFKRLIINADGTANIETIIGRRRKTAAAQKQTESPPSVSNQGQGKAKPSSGQNAHIRIKTVTLQGGKVDFSDRYVKPNVRLVMEDLGGRISGLDNIKENKADVLLRGMVGGNVPMEIKGRVNPLIEKPFVDLNLNFPGIDLSPFTPYSGKYLGYTLEKGQLAVMLSYKVLDNKLAGQNKIKFNQLTFGNPVSSPQATKLPVKLAVALLKDREGNIDLDLPVKGDLNDPEFSMGGIILKMFVNLIVEIVSAPFKMLGALFGGGEELSYLAFDPGQSTIAPERMEKLDTLGKILFERPGLNLEIQGQVEPRKDTDGLRQLRFEENLKAAKLKALVAAGRKAEPLDRIEITPDERNNMIEEAFDAADFPKPRDEKGRLKKLNPPEMEKLLYTAIGISADDLRLLAYQRASAAKEHLLKKGNVQAQKIFIIEPKIQGGGPEKDLQPRVKFNLK